MKPPLLSGGIDIDEAYWTGPLENEGAMPSHVKPLIVLLAAPETSSSVLYGLYDVLYSVGAAFSDMTIGEPGPEAFDVRIVAASAEPFRCTGKILVEPHASLAEIDTPDV